jgi:ferrochelatase
MGDAAKRTAIVLFNLGGPDSPDAVRPFLFNLFNDPAIISAPGIVRWFLAQMISRRRAPFARENYAIMGGKSPLLANTLEQAKALEAALGQEGEVRCFIAMRYWHPFAGEAARDVKNFNPDQVVLLPLYPQYAAATTGSSLLDWQRAAAKVGLDVPTRTICCYPEDSGFIEGMAELTSEAWNRAAKAGEPRILFSAHGLPKREIERGDPYQWQVERTASGIAGSVSRRLGKEPDWRVCYQSRVGPLEWIGPYTDSEIEHAGEEGRPLVVVPLAFVSEHVETLVELDVEYGELAAEKGVPVYERVSTVGSHSEFIEGLAKMVRKASESPRDTGCGSLGGRLCAPELGRCPCRGD